MNSIPETELTRRFSLSLPLVVAPLGGGPTTPALVAASCNAGALGTLACAYLEPAQIDTAVAATRAATARPFALNLFARMPQLELAPAQVEAAIRATRRYRDELGLAEPKLAPPFHPDFDVQFEAVLRARPAAFSFVFGLLDAHHLDACRACGILTMGGATTLDEALALEASGVDFVIAQGREAGAHRAILDAKRPDPDVATLPLVQALAGKLRVPAIAAGGIMDGAGIARVLRAGAVGAQLGTAFLLCREAGTSKPYREALAAKGPTRLTRAFSGRLARGLENRFMREVEQEPAAILPFPAQNAFTRDIRAADAARDSAEFLSLWAGEGVASIRDSLGAAELIAALRDELAAAG